MVDLDSLMSSVPVGMAEPNAVEMTEEQFSELTDRVNALREAITQGQEVSKEDARDIVIWFRARRKKNFSLLKVKEPKAAKEKVERVKKVPVAKRKKVSDMDALELLGDL